MVKCSGSKRDGSPCTATVEPPITYCWWYDPAHAGERRRNASKTGKSKPSRELAGVKGQLQEMVDAVLAGTLNRADAAVTGQLLNVKLRALETERKWRELIEIEERVAALEGREPYTGGQRYGA
jgi:glutathione S-transferase